MTATIPSQTSLSAAELAGRLAAGEQMTLLDVRDDATWSIEAPTARVVHVPAQVVKSDPEAVARQLDGPAVVVCSRGMTAAVVADALREHGADATVLDGGMRAWIAVLESRPVDVGIEGVRVLQVQRPGRGCLSYLVASRGSALVVDPAPGAAFYAELARALGVRITDVADTHLHADHLSGARELADRTGATLRLPRPALDRGVAYADRVEALDDGDAIAIGAVTVTAVALPGHTTDMTGLLLEGSALISGDSLFADGIARPDLQRGDDDGARGMARTLHATLHDRILALGDDVLVLPGHTHPGVCSAAVTASIGAARRSIPELAIDDPSEFAEAVLAGIPARPANYEAVIAVNAGARPFDPDLEAGGNSCATR